MAAATVLLLVFVFSQYLFASTTAHISAMMLAFLLVGAQLVPTPYLVPFLLMMTAGSSIMMTLTHYATGTSPIIFGSGYVTMGNWWRVGFIMCVLDLRRRGRRMVEAAGFLVSGATRNAGQRMPPQPCHPTHEAPSSGKLNCTLLNTRRTCSNCVSATCNNCSIHWTRPLS